MLLGFSQCNSYLTFLFIFSAEATIVLRQDAVSELTQKEDIFFGLQSILGKFVDIGKLINFV